jgi:2-oxoglutarate dehydrogenase E2 component (dihydrolipoamide succinyltransferase)
MSVDIKVPPVGESITEVTLSAWKKKSGDAVKRDEIICELESDKATFELPAEADGIIQIVAKEGDVLPIGGLICTIVTNASSKIEDKVEDKVIPEITIAPNPIVEAAQNKVENVISNNTVIEIKIPAVGESITEVTIASWGKKEGDSVKMDEVLCELESDKATFELPAEAAGILHIIAQAGTVVPIGGVIATIQTSGLQPIAVANSVSEVKVAPASNSDQNHAAHLTPVATNILAEKGIDPSTVAGTGVGGKITKEDALQASKPAISSPVAVPSTESVTNPVLVASEGIGSRGQRREKMSSLRKTVARRLVAVKNETAMLTTFNEVDMKPIMDLRALYKEKFKEKHGVGLGFMSFFTKAVCVALKEFPAVNAKIDGEEIVFSDYCDISIAVSAPKGLVVPVIRNAEHLSLAGIEKEVVRLATKAKENKLTLEEMSGGTFTITNGGVFGSMLSTPIINAPQVAILGMHNIVERAVVIAGQIVVRPIMYVALSYDHRIIDGKDSVSFLVRLKQLLEDPTRLLLDV